LTAKAVPALLAGLGLVVRHWLAVFLVAIGVFLSMPFAAPALAANGHGQAASWIYVAYRVTCHQLPHRSLFLGGERWTYDWPELAARLGIDGPPYSRIHRPVTDPVLGYQVAFCQRDVAVWGALLAGGLAYAAIRRTRRVTGLPLIWFAVATVPVGLDGLSQLAGLRESTPMIRIVTGAIFGGACAWLLLPRFEEALAEAFDLPRGSAGTVP
jgi:uncharacterized membrane protein